MEPERCQVREGVRRCQQVIPNDQLGCWEGHRDLDGVGEGA